MSIGRRHESLIPLSREHHYGLLVCLRIQRGLETHKTDLDWLRERAHKVIRFFQSDLQTHFEVEEEVVFPAMSEIEEAGATIEELLGEHHSLATLVGQLQQAAGWELAPLLREFSNLLEAHIRKEERVLFPCYERNVLPELAAQVKNRVLQSIGTAMKPKHPLLLE
jgi:iron-sulfur cluster repair protein YtfE (RIC family)